LQVEQLQRRYRQRLSAKVSPELNETPTTAAAADR
jgi:hypothetical protein